jgi:hypothetical protein
MLRHGPSTTKETAGGRLPVLCLTPVVVPSGYRLRAGATHRALTCTEQADTCLIHADLCLRAAASRAAVSGTCQRRLVRLRGGGAQRHAGSDPARHLAPAR